MTVTTARGPARRALAVALLSVAAACAEWPVSNPYDPRLDVTVRIVGPDTVRSYGEAITYRGVTEPAWRPEWPPLVVTWAGASATGWSIPQAWLQPQGDESVVVTPQRTEVPAFPLRATVGPHVAFKTPVVRIPLVQMTAYGCTSARGSPMVFEYRVPQWLCYDFIDRDQQHVLWPQEGAVLQASARDRAIVSVGTPPSSNPFTVTVEPLANGLTWLDVVVKTGDGRVWRDSLPVIVRLPR